MGVFPTYSVQGAKKFYSAYSGPYTIIEKIGQVNFKLLRTHDLQPLRNIIYVNRMKQYVHRQLVPPEPDDYEDLKDDQPVHETELHPLNQGKVQELAGEDQLEENNETQIDVVNLVKFPQTYKRTASDPKVVKIIKIHLNG